MAPSSGAPRDLADRVIRRALQHPANLRAFLHQAVPALAGGLIASAAACSNASFRGEENGAASFFCRHRAAITELMPPVTLLESGERQEPFTDSDYITVWVGD